MKKLEVNTIVSIQLPYGTDNDLRTGRFFIQDYNEDERSYTAICFDDHTAGKSITIREKAIASVVDSTPVHPDLSKWAVSDAVLYLAYEVNLMQATYRMDGRDSELAWAQYFEQFAYLKKSPNKPRLLATLGLRKNCFASRAVPVQAIKKSRTVMRRLRKKNTMRNSNSSVAKNKQRTTYVTPVDAQNKYKISYPGISTKRSQKRKKKTLSAELSAQEIRKKEIEKALTAFGKAAADMGVGMPITKLNLTPKKKKKKLDIPF